MQFGLSLVQERDKGVVLVLSTGSGSFYHSFWAVFLSGDAIWVEERTSHVPECGGWAGWVCLFR